jgi:hypothetical protein
MSAMPENTESTTDAAAVAPGAASDSMVLFSAELRNALI